MRGFDFELDNNVCYICVCTCVCYKLKNYFFKARYSLTYCRLPGAYFLLCLFNRGLNLTRRQKVNDCCPLQISVSHVIVSLRALVQTDFTSLFLNILFL